MMFKFLSVNNIFEFEKKIKIIKKDLKLKTKLSDINSKIPQKFDIILKEINSQRLKNNPVKIEKKDLLNILKKIS